ncbi:MAG TPA: DUF4384 domain-containing protein [Pyrinomonadaceae bacterium]|nr:DUF4384 domain-containing protein [Pyrinomonadaceae bacterium]
MKEKCLFAVCLVIFAAFGFAQVKTNSAKEEFEIYGRGGIGEDTPIQTRTPIGGIKPQGGGIKKTPTLSKSPTPIRSVGKPGMKIWFERQIGCKKNFVRVAPTTIFRSGDCIRVQFWLNFTGYLTVINNGTTGTKRVIFPAENQSNQVFPKTPYYLPDNGGVKFDANPGNEQLIFIASKLPLKESIVEDSVKNRKITEESPDIEIYERDLVPRIEKNDVYILEDETKLSEALVFRMTLKHR